MLKVEMKEPSKEWGEITKYPCLGKSRNSDLVVLFRKEGCGMVLAPDSFWRVGDSHESWAMNMFTPFDGELTISNV